LYISKNFNDEKGNLFTVNFTVNFVGDKIMFKVLSIPVVILGVVLFTPAIIIALSIVGAIATIARPFYSLTKAVFAHHNDSIHAKAA